MRFLFFITIFFLVFSIFPSVYAEDSLAISVTPPLFQLNIDPGGKWTSSVKVVNTNSYELSIYTSVMNFEAKGEKGKGKIIPLESSDAREYSLAGWIEIEEGPVVIPRGSSKEIKFTINVPDKASPGGHYAAILVGTKPATPEVEGSAISVSSYVTSLFFLRIKGDIVEEGRIRQFSSELDLYQTPRASFVLRFENMGNVHLQPQGNIVIYNMWGKERGKLFLNQKHSFGNVLPESIRRFEFEWIGEGNIFEMGRYKAVTTLAYGEENRKNVSAITYFWIIPVMPLAACGISLLFFIIVVVWLIRRYIKRALRLEAERLGVVLEQEPKLKKFTRPFVEGVSDLTEARKPLSFFQFFKKYALFFLFLAVIIMGVFGLWYYFKVVLTPERNFDIKIKNLIGEEKIIYVKDNTEE